MTERYEILLMVVPILPRLSEKYPREDPNCEDNATSGWIAIHFAECDIDGTRPVSVVLLKQ
ncbi:hypothetical protein T265_06946 [Opisthorchis viverrini]|uniref:Uncharacterized protein n=1 Tax=Opisthorchis viverrini TaxID=6198 RepID=A0A074ZER7_OPIVI|nr:hypothetical protein T265_06946 [Opisthorchis viverrini]KER25658.1 hypothetical protein T265_06946 [Opisthorchis viverrini]